MPRRLASGAKTCSDSSASVLRAGSLVRGVPAQRLQARSQPQQAPRASRAKRPAASCARARSARHAGRHPPARRAPRAGSAPACASASPDWRSCRRRPCAPFLRGAAGSRRHTPGRRPRTAWARRRSAAAAAPRRRHGPARLRRCAGLPGQQRLGKRARALHGVGQALIGHAGQMHDGSGALQAPSARVFMARAETAAPRPAGRA
jgi:hypothetical protein